jgi:hypothetical protein
VFENLALKRFSDLRRKVTGGSRKLRSDEVHNLYSSSHYWDDEIREGGVSAA